MAQYARGVFTITAASGTTVNVTSPGFQPTWAVLYWVGRGAADGEGSANAQPLGFGFSDGTSDFSSCIYEEDGATTTVTAYRQNITASVLECTSTGTDAGYASLTMTASGFDVVIGVNFTTSFEVGFVCGDDANVAIGDLRPGTTGSATVNGLGFTPGLLLGISTRRSSDTTNGGQGASLGFGAFDGTNQWGIAAGMDDDTTTTSQGRYGIGTEMGAVFSGSATTIIQRVLGVSFASGEFTVNFAEGGTFNWMYLAIGGGSYAVGDALTQTVDTTTDAISGVGFQPELLLFGSVGDSEHTSDTPDVATASMLSIGAATSTTDRHCMGYSSQDGLGTSEVYTARYTDRVYIHPDLADSHDGAMDISAIGSDGFTIIADDGDPSQNFYGWVAFGNPAASGGMQLVGGAGLVGSNG
jgi:hypothetical protein